MGATKAVRLTSGGVREVTVEIARTGSAQRRNRLMALEPFGTISFLSTYDFKRARKKRVLIAIEGPLSENPRHGALGALAVLSEEGI